MEEEAGDDGAQEEGGEGGEDVQMEKLFVRSPVLICTKLEPGEVPDEPAKEPGSAHPDVDPSELLTEPDTLLTTSTVDLLLGEGEEGHGREEQEEGVVGEDLDGVLTSEIDGGEDGQEILGEEKEA